MFHKTLLIGSHVSMSGKDMLRRASKEAASYGANTFLIYTGAPHNTLRKPIHALKIDEDHAHMREHGISNIVVHANWRCQDISRTPPTLAIHIYYATVSSAIRSSY